MTDDEQQAGVRGHAGWGAFEDVSAGGAAGGPAGGAVFALRALAAEARPRRKVRHVHVDAVKALGICLVVLCHASPVEELLRHPLLMSTLGPAVPAFMSASGFLYSKNPTVANMWRRLFRVVVPYTCASIFATTLQHFRSPEAAAAASPYTMPATEAPLVEDFLLGLALPHYYFIFVLVLLLLATPAIGCCSARALKVLLCISILLHLAFKAGLEFALGFNTTWILRNPFIWLGFFLCGWMSPMWTAVPKWKTIVALLVTMPMQILIPYPVGLLIWMYAAVICVPLLFPPGTRIPGCQRAVMWLSANSYTVFLYHAFFLEASASWLNHTSLEGTVLYVSVWAISISCSVLLAATALAVLGPVVGGLIFGCSLPPPAEADVDLAKQQDVAQWQAP